MYMADLSIAYLKSVLITYSKERYGMKCTLKTFEKFLKWQFGLFLKPAQQTSGPVRNTKYYLNGKCNIMKLQEVML